VISWPRMNELPISVMRRMAALAGFEWTDEELEALRPTVERSLAVIEKLQSVPLAETEPATQFRMF
jgi:Asp-tRNA(Asn)/Glu-tRNA(Gln) amidotransferase C subunit